MQSEKVLAMQPTPVLTLSIYCHQILFVYYFSSLSDYINEINSPGRTTYNPPEFWLADSSGKGKKSALLVVSARLTQQSWHLRNVTPLNKFAKFLSKEPCSIFLILPPCLHILHITHITYYTYYAWVGARNHSFRVKVLPSLRDVVVYYKFGFTLSWTANCISAEPCIDFFSGKPSMDGREAHFEWCGSPFSPDFGLSFTRKGQKMEKERSFLKINIMFGLSTLKYPYEHPSLCIFLKKYFWQLKNIALI